jgi:hypothetical protein
MSPATVTFLYVDVLALRGSASPCVLPLAPLDGLAFRGSLPLFLFLILGIMMGVEVLVRGQNMYLRRGETCRVGGIDAVGCRGLGLGVLGVEAMCVW